MHCNRNDYREPRLPATLHRHHQVEAPIADGRLAVNGAMRT